jgi:hypothetical protein
MTLHHHLLLLQMHLAVLAPQVQKRQMLMDSKARAAVGHRNRAAVQEETGWLCGQTLAQHWLGSHQESLSQM